MKLIIENIIILSKDLIDAGQFSGKYESIIGVLSPQRNFIISDADDKYNPFSDSGLLNPKRIGFKNKEIKYFDDDNNLLYAGVITTIKTSENKNTKILTIVTKSAVGNLLKYPIEDNDKTTHSGFSLDGEQGTNRFLLIKGGTTVLPDISVMTHSDSLVPNYQASPHPGDPTVSIDLDRELEFKLLADQPLSFTIPIYKTAAAAMRDALQIALTRIGLQSLLDVGSFDAINSIDAAANRLLWVFVRVEDNITLGQHLNNLSDMSGILVRVSNEGRISAVKQMAWDGINPGVRITVDEIIYQIDNNYEPNNLLYGYSLPYIAGKEVKLASEVLQDTDQRLLDYGAIKIKRLATLKSGLIITNNYLYNNFDTAKYYGDLFLNYYSISRQRFACNVSLYFLSGATVGLNLFDEFMLTYGVYTNEPVKILQFDLNEKKGSYENCIFELVNKEFPGLPTA